MLIPSPRFAPEHNPPSCAKLESKWQKKYNPAIERDWTDIHSIDFSLEVKKVIQNTAN